MPDDKLLQYFMEQTNQRFDKTDVAIQGLHQKLDGLCDFKIKTVVNTRWISGIISVTVGVLTFAITTAVAIHSSRAERKAIMDAAKIERVEK